MFLYVLPERAHKQDTALWESQPHTEVCSVGPAYSWRHQHVWSVFNLDKQEEYTVVGLMRIFWLTQRGQFTRNTVYRGFTV